MVKLRFHFIFVLCMYPNRNIHICNKQQLVPSKESDYLNSDRIELKPHLLVFHVFDRSGGWKKEKP